MVQALHRGNRARKAAKRGADALRAYAANLFPRPPPVDDEEEVDPSIPEHNRDIKVASGSLFIMSDEAELRHKLNKFLNGKPVDTFLLFCILTNVFILAIETPTATFRPAFVDLFHTVDFTLSVVFSSKRAQYNHCRCRSTPLQLLQQVVAAAEGRARQQRRWQSRRQR